MASRMMLSSLLILACAIDTVFSCGASLPWQNQLGFLITSRQLADSRLTASSSYSANHGPHRARMDKYFDYACSWSAGSNTLPQWIEVDLVTATTVVGIAIKKRCDSGHTLQWVKGYRVEAFVEGKWQAVHEQEQSSYIGEFQFAFFENPARARKWRVVVLSYNYHVSMKFDLIGYI